MNEIAREFLQTYARGAEPAGGWQFAKALQQTRLDYGDDSLVRLDRLFAAIRERARPDRAAFAASTPGRNFCALVAFYLVAIVERRTGARIEWHDFASASTRLAGRARLPAGAFSRLVALAPEGGAVLLPLGWIDDTLFGPGTARPAAEAVAAMCAQVERADLGATSTIQMPLDALGGAAMAGATVLAVTIDGDDSDDGDDGADPSYADGEPLRAGDAVLAEGGVVPARVAAVHRDAGGAVECVVEDARGAVRTLDGAQLAGTLVLIGRDAPDPAAAFASGLAWLEERAQPGAPAAAAPARHALGRLHWEGLLVARDPELAIRHWQAAADSGHAPAECEIGCALLDGGAADREAARAVNFLRRAADKGHPRALGRLGALHETGVLVTADLERAVVCYLQAAAGGDAHAMTQLARLHRAGEGVPRDEGRALALLHEAATLGAADAQFALGRHYGEPDAPQRDDALAAQWVARAAAQGHAAAVGDLAAKFEQGVGVARDPAKALALYTEAAALDDPVACRALGLMRFEGRGVERDVPEAMRLMRRAVAQGVRDAKAQLARFEAEGHAGRLEAAEAALAQHASLDEHALHAAAAAVYDPNVEASKPLAFALYLRAARRGHADAQYQVALRYRRGLGVAQSKPIALEWYERAAAQGSRSAHEDLGELWEAGDFGPRNHTLAFAHTRSAAAAGSVIASYRVARMYEDGRGTTRDLALALRWMDEAARHAIADAPARAAALRDALAERTRAARAEARKSAWKFWA